MNNTSLLDSIREQIRNKPDGIAVIQGHQIITYRDLAVRANCLACYLQNNQVKQGSSVVIFMRRSFEMLVAILAIWECGAAYLPIDPQTPLKRIKQIFDEAKPDCIVTESALLGKIKDQNIPALTLRDLAYFHYEQSVLDFSAPPKNYGKQLAYIIYTSGSTGTPKGVMVSQDNLKNHVAWLIECFQFSSKDVFSFNSPLAFDFSVPCMLAPLVVGATIVVTSESDTLALEYYCQQLVENRITFVKWTPSYFKLLVEYVEKHQPDLSSMRYLMVAGEELLTTYVERWLNVYPTHHIVNEYGPTETTVGITAHIVTKNTLDKNCTTVPIGKAVSNTELYILDAQKHPVKKGEVGELFIGGASVACGYYNRPDLTNDRFIDSPFSSVKKKLYKTGDMVRQLPDGSYLYIGRIDQQVKINGYRIELHEIEYRLLQHGSVKQAAVTVTRDDEKNIFLVAYIVLKEKEILDQVNIRDYLSQHLPHYMIPQVYHVVSHIPLTANGKRDYSQLASQILKQTPESQASGISSRILECVVQILKKHIHISSIDLKSSFFSMGVTSLLSAQIVVDINKALNSKLRINDLFLYSTPLALARFLEDQQANLDAYSTRGDLNRKKQSHHEPIAIIAMECRYPNADNCDALWDMCRSGKEGITFFDVKEAGHPQIDQSYVGARGILNNIEYFDAAFFNYSPKEAHLSDPQHRLFLEAAWTALEKAGYAPGSKQLGIIGVYASMNDSTYIVNHCLTELGKDCFPDAFSLLRLMSSQFLATKIAYQLDCTGPALSIQTACSSSLVSVVLACQQLSAYQCDVALAGGVSITTPQDKPYLYQPENIFSPDGHCRPFDANAKGTVFSNGLGVVVLKRLSDALRDNDTIISIIKGASMNNDGADKMSYAAPSIKAQAACISSAQAVAGISAESIQYVEAHGTGTLVGDPIEIEALAMAFREASHHQQFCAIGSLKANIGHTHVAAGVAGLIKTALALQNNEIPPAVNFTEPNPNIDFAHSPFYVNTRLQHWPRAQYPRRAAVSAFGVGGTNAHVILEEAPELSNYPTSRQYHALLLSAKTPEALKEYQDKLIGYLEEAVSQQDQYGLLADIAFTFQQGRLGYQYRSGIVSENISDAIAKLKEAKDKIDQVNNDPNHQQIVFLFPGQGTQYVNLSLELYQNEPIYRKHLDNCFNIASAYTGVDLEKIIFTDAKNSPSAESRLYETEFAHPILFSIEYALAQLLISFGVKPDMMLGHSLGEYVAACLSGVFTLKDAIKVVCARGNAIAKCVQGEMLAIPLSQEKLLPFCNADISIAAINAPQLCVVSGTKSAMRNFREKLAPTLLPEQVLSIREIKSNYPFHSALLNPAAQSLKATLKSIRRMAPTVPYLSNLTGNWITEEEIQRDDYWVEHMLKTVQFSACAKKLLENPHAIFVEIGPSNTLLSLLQQQAQYPLNTLGLLPNAASKNKEKSDRKIIEALKQLWVYGCHIEWSKYYSQEKRRRIPLPTYPFQRQRYWFDEVISNERMETYLPLPKSDISFYVPTWVRDPETIKSPTFLSLQNKQCRWIIFDNCAQLSQKTVDYLDSSGEDIIVIRRGKSFECDGRNRFTINPILEEHYCTVIEKTISKGINNYIILHFWSMDQDQVHVRKNLLDSAILYQGFYSGIFIAKALSRLDSQPNISCLMVTTQVHSVLGDEFVDPLKSSVLSICRVLPLEHPTMRVGNIDLDPVDIPENSQLYLKNIIDIALKNMFSGNECATEMSAFRNKYRWLPSYQSVGSLKKQSLSQIKIEPKGVYLITGGLGGMGLTFANWLSGKEPLITLVLVSRTPFPAEKEWQILEKNLVPENATIKKIKLLRTITARGSRIVIKAGDVADYSVMKKIISSAEKKYGRLRGIFHLAGIPGEGLAELKEVDSIRSVLSPKIQGIWVLARLLRLKELDFVICASSLTAIAGGVGQIDYCAANIFLDSFMSSKVFKNCRKQLTINWNAWDSIGMAANLVHSKTHSKLYEGNSISPEEGTAILDSLFCSDYTHLIVSRFSPEDEARRIVKTFNADKVHEERGENYNHFICLSETGIYESVAQCWKEILGVKVVQGDDSFYALGGDSLLAIQLLVMLKQRFNIDISLQSLVGAHTLNAMVKLIECQPVRSEQVIVPLSDHNLKLGQKTIYFIHPVGGTILCYFPLIPRLKNTLSYYAIQDPELMRGEFLFDSIKAMAAYYADEIFKHQESNKATEIVLIGSSFGGNVAVEVAAQLKTRPIPVQKIILIDSWADVEKATNHSPLSSTSPDELESIKLIRQYYGVHSEHYRLIKARLSWLQKYIPTQIEIPVILLKAKEILPYYEDVADESNGWKRYFRQPLTVHDIPGSHDTMLKPENLDELCTLLKALF